jgi:hypothetical protein
MTCATGLDARLAEHLWCAKTRTLPLSWCFLCPLGCSPVLADQALDDAGALDPGGHIDRLTGLVQRRPLSRDWWER